MVDKKLVKSAGESFVCAMLAMHGWAASLTRDGLARTDILAVQTADDSERQAIEVQVKACSPGTVNWPIGSALKRHAVSDREWFVLVQLRQPPESPRYFIAPRDHVTAGAWIEHMSWLTDPAAPKGKRNTPVTNARTLIDPWSRYENRWDWLKLPTTEIPVVLPSEWEDLMHEKRVGLPPGHPWQADPPSWQATAD